MIEEKIIRQKIAEGCDGKDLIIFFGYSKTTIIKYLKLYRIEIPLEFFGKHGRPKGIPMSVEQKEKLSKNNSGDKNPFFGKKHSNETKRKMSSNHADFSGDKNPFKKSITQDPEKIKQHSRKCRETHPTKYKIGDKFGSLLIESFKYSEDNHKIAVCHCDCGNTYEIRPSLFSVNATHHCGCEPIGSWKGIGLISGTYFNRVKRSAKKRSLLFSLTKEYLWELFKKQNGFCALSNISITPHRKDGIEYTASLNRINSSIGYIEGNVQWVHKDINLMKMDLELNRFIELCKLVSNNNK